MEKSLGWIVGGVGTVLLGVMAPIVAFAQPLQSASSTSVSPQTASLAPASTGSTTTSTSSSSTSETGPSSTVSGNQGTSQNAKVPLPEKVQYVDQVAKNAVGGGTVTNLTVNTSRTQPVWNVTVTESTGTTYQVQISTATYSVVGAHQQR